MQAGTVPQVLCQQPGLSVGLLGASSKGFDRVLGQAPGRTVEQAGNSPM